MTEENSSCSDALRGCIEALGRCDMIVREAPRELFAGGEGYPHPIGPHFRHCLEHVTCFLDGLKRGEVDYDARVREEPLERDPEYFLAALKRTCDTLRTVDPESLSREIFVRQTPALDAERIRMRSTVEREIVFISSHTIHHVALIRHICLAAGVELPPETGLAFSTAAHQQTVAG